MKNDDDDDDAEVLLFSNLHLNGLVSCGNDEIHDDDNDDRDFCRFLPNCLIFLEEFKFEFHGAFAFKHSSRQFHLFQVGYIIFRIFRSITDY